MKMIMTLGALALATTVLAERTYQYKDISSQNARVFQEKDRTPGSERAAVEETKTKKIHAAKTIEEKIEDNKKEREGRH